MCLLGQLYFGLLLLQHGRPKLLLCLRLRLLNQFQIQFTLDELLGRFNFFSLQETLVTVVTPFHENIKKIGMRISYET